MSDSQLLAAILAELRELRKEVASHGMPAGDDGVVEYVRECPRGGR